MSDEEEVRYTCSSPICRYDWTLIENTEEKDKPKVCPKCGAPASRYHKHD